MGKKKSTYIACVFLLVSAAFLLFSEDQTPLSAKARNAVSLMLKKDFTNAASRIAKLGNDPDREQLQHTNAAFLSALQNLKTNLKKKKQIKVPGLGTVVSVDSKAVTVSMEGSRLPFLWSMMKDSEFYQLYENGLKKEQLESFYAACAGLNYLAYKDKKKNTAIAKLKALFSKAEKKRCNTGEIVLLLARLGVKTGSIHTNGTMPSVTRPKKPKTPLISPGRETAVWRPFSDKSPWNMKIPPDPEIDPRSDEMINDMSTSSQWKYLDMNLRQYSIPVFYIDSTSIPEVSCHARLGRGKTHMLPIPDYCKPAAGTDRHACIIDRKLMISWDFWDMTRRSDGSWACGVYAKMDLKSDGVRTPRPTRQT